MRTTPVLLVTTLLSLLLASGSSAAGDRPKAQIDEGRIYYGDSRNFEKPAQVNVDAVYRKIPEYQEILRQNLTEKDPKYIMYMRTATDTFLGAVSAAAARHGYDLIGAPGSIVIEGGRVPDITAQVIAELPK